jgi:carbon storage regulator
MLVLSRKVGESIQIGENIRLTVSSVNGSRVKICVEAPRELPVRRQEIDTIRNGSDQNAVCAVAVPTR